MWLNLLFLHASKQANFEFVDIFIKPVLLTVVQSNNIP